MKTTNPVTELRNTHKCDATGDESIHAARNIITATVKSCPCLVLELILILGMELELTGC